MKHLSDLSDTCMGEFARDYEILQVHVLPIFSVHDGKRLLLLLQAQRAAWSSSLWETTSRSSL